MPIVTCFRDENRGRGQADGGGDVQGLRIARMNGPSTHFTQEDLLIYLHYTLRAVDTTRSPHSPKL